MSEENKQISKSESQSTKTQPSPFANLKPAEIPVKFHTFSYQGKSGESNKETYEQKGKMKMFAIIGIIIIFIVWAIVYGGTR